MTKYILSPGEIAQFKSYLDQRQKKQAEIEQCIKTIQQNQMDVEKINGVVQGTITSTAIANGALAPGAPLESLNVSYDFNAWELTWPDHPVPHREPKKQFKRKRKG